MNQIVGSGKEAYKQCKKDGVLPAGSYYIGPKFKGHFEVLWTDFRPDEEVRMFFPAVYLGGSSGFVGRDSGVACALTDKHFLLAQKLPLKTVEKAIQIGMLANVNITGKMSCDELTVTTNTEQMVLRVSKKIGKRIYDAIQDSIGKPAASIAVAPVVVQQTAPAPQQPDATNEVRRLKSLLDDGLINEDEFNALKRKALGL